MNPQPHTKSLGSELCKWYPAWSLLRVERGLKFENKYSGVKLWRITVWHKFQGALSTSEPSIQWSSFGGINYLPPPGSLVPKSSTKSKSLSTFSALKLAILVLWQLLSVTMEMLYLYVQPERQDIILAIQHVKCGKAQAWWYTPIISILRRLRQENSKLLYM